MKIRVAVIYGGRTGEHEVSVRSAQAILAGLDPAKYEKIEYFIDKEGKWNPAPILPEPGAHPRVDVVFPVLHGTFGEDGTVQGLLELAGLPYVGAGVLASAVGMDKDVQKRLFEQAGLPIVPFLAVRRAEWEHERAKVLKRIKKTFRFPLFVKPATSGSSLGMTRVKAAHEIPAALDLAAEFALKIIVERAVTAREIEVSVLGNDEVRASMPGEILPHREFYDYTAKYLEEGTQLLIPAPLTKKQVRVFQEYAIRSFR